MTYLRSPSSPCSAPAPTALLRPAVCLDYWERQHRPVDPHRPQ